jgi:hypothetical protein
MWMSHWIPDASPQSLGDALRRLDADPATGALWVFAADADGYTPESLDPVLTTLRAPVFGGVYPQVIWGAQHHVRGAIIVALAAPLHLAVIEQLSALTDAADPRLALAVPDALPEASCVTVIVDGLSRGIAALLTHLFHEKGTQ